MTELPSGWSETTTGALLSFVTSGSRGWARYYTEDGAPFIRVGNLQRGTIAPDLSDVQHVSPPDGAEGSRTRVASNDILISITADLGRIAVMEDVRAASYINQHVALARPTPDVNSRYLGWYLTSERVQRQWATQQRGVTKLGLGLDDIRSIAVPLAPSSEQRRIVAAIEEQFSRLDAGLAALGRAQKNLKRLRAALLEAALRGGWPTRPLLEVCRSIADGDHQPPPQTSSGVPFLVIGNVRSGSIDFAGCRRVSPRYYSKLDPKRQPTKGDVLYTVVGSYGIPILVTGDEPFCVQRHIAVLRPSSELDAGFLAHVLAGGSVRKQADSCATGTAQKTVPLSGLRRIRIVVPPIERQREIRAALDLHQADIDRVAATVAEQAKRSAVLRIAVLAAAYSGDLTAQDPGDEPVADLPRRVVAEGVSLNGRQPMGIGSRQRARAMHE